MLITTETYSNFGGIKVGGCCPTLEIKNTRIRITKQREFGLYSTSALPKNPFSYRIINCQFEESQSVGGILYSSFTNTEITNCTFSNNTGNISVIVIDCKTHEDPCCTFTNSSISDNSMTGIRITGSSTVQFNKQNVIRNNRNTEGAGITMQSTANIVVQGRTIICNNTADKHGGAILVTKSLLYLQNQALLCAHSPSLGRNSPV